MVCQMGEVDIYLGLRVFVTAQFCAIYQTPRFCHGVNGRLFDTLARRNTRLACSAASSINCRVSPLIRLSNGNRENITHFWPFWNLRHDVKFFNNSRILNIIGLVRGIG